jgi:hypothetical protein
VRLTALCAAAAAFATGVFAQDAREIVRKSVELDQANWLRMKDYTWVARSSERRFDSNGKVKSEESSAWETIILSGEPYRRMLERNGKPLPPDELRKQQEKLDKNIAKLQHETAGQKQRRLDEYEKQRLKDRAFLREIPDAYDVQLAGDAKVDGRDVWVIVGTPKPGYRPKDGQAKALEKIRAKLWVDKNNYQWVRLEAESTGTISFGLFLARLNPGAKLVFEQTRVNDEVWLPKHLFLKGTGRLGLLVKVASEQDITWNDYRKFQVNSKIVGTANERE